MKRNLSPTQEKALRLRHLHNLKRSAVADEMGVVKVDETLRQSYRILGVPREATDEERDRIVREYFDQCEAAAASSPEPAQAPQIQPRQSFDFQPVELHTAYTLRLRRIIAAMLVVTVIVAIWWLLTRPKLAEISINPSYFEIQDGDGDGIADEFLFDTRYDPLPLPKTSGVDLREFDLELVFEGGDGKLVQLFFKFLSPPQWLSVYSHRYIIVSGEPILWNPLTDGRDVDEFRDFSHIHGLGAKIEGGIEGLRIVSVRLIRR